MAGRTIAIAALLVAGCQSRPAAAPAAVRGSTPPVMAIAPTAVVAATARRTVGPTEGAEHYLAELIGQTDGTITRWNRATSDPVQVWIAPPPRALAGWRDGFSAAVWDAFSAWNAAGLPVWFAPASDSARADVRVMWTQHLEDTDATARATWWVSHTSEIVSGLLLIGLTSTDSQPLDTNSLRGVALHEIGHLLGLPHTSCYRCVMFGFVQVNDLDPRDIETARRWYARPPGRLSSNAGSSR